ARRAGKQKGGRAEMHGRRAARQSAHPTSLPALNSCPPALNSCPPALNSCLPALNSCLPALPPSCLAMVRDACSSSETRAQLAEGKPPREGQAAHQLEQHHIAGRSRQTAAARRRASRTGCSRFVACGPIRRNGAWRRGRALAGRGNLAVFGLPPAVLVEVAEVGGFSRLRRVTLGRGGPGFP